MDLAIGLMDFKNVRIIPNTPSRVNSRSECKTNITISGLDLTAPFIVPPMHSLWSLRLMMLTDDHKYLSIVPRNVLLDRGRLQEMNRVAFNASIDDAMEYAALLDTLEVKHRVLSIEVANGHMQKLADKIKEVKDNFPNIPVWAGTVCTPEGVDHLIQAGADVALIGIGVGSACLTTPNTGVGLPAFATVTICASAGHPIVLTGGLREPGDVAKAIGAGADGVYVGALIKGCDDAHDPNKYWGEASEYQKGLNASHIEGKVEEIKPKNQTSVAIMNMLQDHLKSAMSYSDAFTIQEFQKNCLFGRIE